MFSGFGGVEAVVIMLLALVIIGPKDLPVLMRRLARWVNKVRGMAAEFRMSFDELARQSELDELRREVEALRRGDPVTPIHDHMSSVSDDLHASLNGHDSAYQAALAEANGDAAPHDPYTPSFTAEPQAEMKPLDAAEAKPKTRRKAKPQEAEANLEAETEAPKPVRKPRAPRKTAETVPTTEDEA